MRLDEDKKLLKDNVVNTAFKFDILQEYVEKDYWLFLLLKEIFKDNKRGYVFKGGTSLSKCHHLINRFSEDIDISYASPFATVNSGEIKRKFRGITKAIKAIGLEIDNADKLRWNRYFNQFQCPYSSICESNSIDKKVIIELAAQTPSFPSETKQFTCYIGEYLDSIDRHDLVIEYGLEPFELQVQTLSRTLVDKTFAICDYYLSKKCQRHSRHIYDISKLVDAIELNQGLADLFNEVRDYRKNLKVCKSAQEGIKLMNVIDKIIVEDAFKEDYEKITMPLLYEKYHYQKCKEHLIKLRDFLTNNDL